MLRFGHAGLPGPLLGEEDAWELRAPLPAVKFKEVATEFILLKGKKKKKITL